MARRSAAAADIRAVVAIVLVALFAVVVLRSAWMHDDAYITFRTADNFVHGYGLRWNVSARVQTYTHPLWLLLASACYALTGEIYFTVISLSLALSVAAALLVVFGAARCPAAGCFAVVVLTLSKAFVDYSTSGLENPLTNLLFGAFVVVLFRGDGGVRTLYGLASLAALGTFNRMDTLFLYVPAVALVWFRGDRVRGLEAVTAGFLPFVLWEVFAVFYYGFPFPNTAYAKLFDTGVSRGEQLLHGVYYFQNAARTDPITLLAIGVGVVTGLRSADRRDAAVAAGIAAYVSYVFVIGGDFITGRFLTAAVLGGVVLISRWQPMCRTAVAAVASVVAMVVGLSWNDSPPLRTSSAGSRGETLMDAHGIADERAYYYPYSGFLKAMRGQRVSSHPWSLEGLDARRRHVRVTFRGDIGFYGFHAGPYVHVVDVWGLADPLIARLPARTDVGWRVGHFPRAIPDGYEETLLSGQNRIADPEIAALYERLALITRGPLLSSRRLAEIWKMNVSR